MKTNGVKINLFDDEKVFELKILFDRCFSDPKIFEIGEFLEIEYFKKTNGIHNWDKDRALYEITSNLNEKQLTEIFTLFEPWKWVNFRGKRYTYTNGRISFKNSWESLRLNFELLIKKHGKLANEVIDIISRSTNGENSDSLNKQISLRYKKTDISKLLEELYQTGLIIPVYQGEIIIEWKIPQEIIPEVQSVIRGEKSFFPSVTENTNTVSNINSTNKQDDYLIDEKKRIEVMNNEFDVYLKDIIENRLNQTVNFGKNFSILSLVNYLKNMFGEILYFDSFLSIIQQYGLSDISIRSESKKGSIGIKTGFNLALFGEPGTGKSYSTRDIILGTNDGSVPPHGLPGRNRYAAGMTPARFIRIGQVYTDRAWNFIVPEFNDWFRFEGMVEILKLAMERGEIRYELHREVVGPYRFSSYFSVNYNTQVFNQGYRATIKDPNFQAIEDRMICRLHRLTKGRYEEIAQSRLRMVMGESDFGETSKNLRDHLVLTHAIETQHPFVKDKFSAKPPMITKDMLDTIKKTRESILEHLPNESVPFSARLEDRSIRLASALSLIEFFQTSEEIIPISKYAQRYAAQFYIEEAAVRSGVELNVEDILNKVGF